MSGYSLAFNSTPSSIFFACAYAAPFSRIPFKLVSILINIGTDA